MAEYLPPETVPNPSLQDVVLMDFACPDKSQSANKAAPDICPGVFQEAWASQPEFVPLILNTGSSSGQAKWWAQLRLAGALKGKFAEGVTAGRIAAIGFSEGCQGIKELLSSDADAAKIDFVYACDGMHAEVQTQTNCGPGVVSISSLEPWIRFAVRAAEGKTMMVVTCTEICPYNRKSASVATTAESAKALLQEVQNRTGNKTIAARTIPRGLIGQEGFAPMPPNGTHWPAWSNDMNRAVKFYPPWAVKNYAIMGNLIIVWFNSTTPDDVDKYGNQRPSQSLGSAHIFQAWWVMRQVIMEVLACRWAAKCDTVNINPDAVSGLGALLQPTTYVDRRFPSVIQRPNPAMLRQIGSARRALGEMSRGCLVEGNFSKFSAAELQGGLATALNTYSTAELAIGALGLTVGGIALYKYLTR